LRCSIAPQEKDEGDDNFVFLFFLLLLLQKKGNGWSCAEAQTFVELRCRANFWGAALQRRLLWSCRHLLFFVSFAFVAKKKKATATL
jgi:hypothetical protein